jgi:nucleotide-binding universal stress UspA family protein
MNSTNDVRPVIAGIDGTEAAIEAARFAATAAAATGSALLLVAVTGDGDPVLDQVYARDSLRGASRAVAEMRLDVDVTSEVLDGAVADVLRKRSADAALLVLGSRRKGFAARLVFGSTTGALARSAQCPIAVAPAEPAPEVVGLRPVVAFVAENIDRVAIETAIDAARTRDAELLVLAAGAEPEPVLDRIRELAADLDVDGITVRGRVPGQLQYLAGRLALVVVEGPRAGNHSLRPVAREVLFDGRFPVLIVPAVDEVLATA